ncbi:MAG: 16S rRNA (guanine(527)-N(7))-methyltransferase RsmG [Actinomycetes bacterium]
MTTVELLLGHPFGVPEPRAAALQEVLEASRELGFLGPGPAVFHVEHARLLLSLTPTVGRALDLGSGGGVPGLIVAVARPHLEVVLLDAMAKRCDFLTSSVHQLGLDGAVRVAHGRAEDLARREDLRGTCDLVTARSFGPPAATAECAAAFLRVGGRLLVSEPPEQDADRWPAGPLSELGLELSGRHADGRSTVAELCQTELAGPQIPRRDGVPARKPRW